MGKKVYHPNAFLTDFRNVKPGLKTRSTVLNLLEKGAACARTMAEQTGLHYSVVMYHLKLLESRGIVQHKGSRPYIWKSTGLGQKRLAY